MPESHHEELVAQVAGQKLSIKTASLNTIATVITLVLVCVSTYVLGVHTVDTREASRELAMSIKDQTQVAREQNCLISLPQERREQNVDLCKRISR